MDLEDPLQLVETEELVRLAPEHELAESLVKVKGLLGVLGAETGG